MSRTKSLLFGYEYGLFVAMGYRIEYDALGRRIEKTINGTTTRYLYDGSDIILEMDESNVATAYYIRTLNIDEPLARIELDSSGNVTGIRFYLADALGSIIALTDENGVIKTQYNYTPFGEVETIGEQSDNPFQFAGRENDEGTGLLFERNRYYSPVLGRYISEDPIGFAGGDINFYVRVGNNPVNFVDPFGLCASGVYHFEGIEYGGFLFVVGVKSAHLKFTCMGDPSDTFTATFTSIAIGGGLGGGVGTPAGAVKGCNEEEVTSNFTGFGGSITLYPGPFGIPSKPGFGASAFWSSNFKAGGAAPGYGMEASGSGHYTFKW
jgi:RHS repeat-associated protein